MNLIWFFILSRFADVATTALNYVRFGGDVAEMSSINFKLMSLGLCYFLVYQIVVTGVILIFIDKLPNKISKIVLKAFSYISLIVSISNFVTFLLIK
jgi:hypothetical protein